MASRIALALSRIAIVIAIFAVWEMLARTGLVNPRLLPPASETLATLADLLERASVATISWSPRPKCWLPLRSRCRSVASSAI